MHYEGLMKKQQIFLPLLTLLFFELVVAPSMVWASQPNGSTGKYIIASQDSDQKIMPELVGYFDNGILKIEKLFHRPFPHQFSVEIYPTRKKANRYWQTLFKDSRFDSPCWMVATGVADKLALLSPQSWQAEACEHQFSNKQKLQALVTHEMTHVYHGQNNPIPDFEGLDPMGWFVEGLAVYVSGQLEQGHLLRAKQAIKKGEIPKSLQTAWQGKYRYGVCGTMVMLIYKKYGANTLKQLLSVTSNKEILSVLNTDEATFIKSWKSFVLGL